MRLHTSQGVSGLPLYAVQRDAQGRVWATGSPGAWQAPSATTRAASAVALAEESTATGEYSADQPAGSEDAVKACFYLRAGVTPAFGDMPVGEQILPASMAGMQGSGTANDLAGTVNRLTQLMPAKA
jgi:hypothetical protein